MEEKAATAENEQEKQEEQVVSKEKEVEKSHRKSKDEKSSKKKDDKVIEHLLKSLTHLHTPEEKLSAVCKKYAEVVDESKKHQFNIKVMDKKVIVLQREKEQLQGEHSKSVMTRSKLENLCRELQKQNKLMKDESLQRIKEEEEKRKEVSAKFHSTLADITALMQQNTETNTKLRDENIEMQNKFKSVCEQYELREQQVEKISKQMKLEGQLAETRLRQAKLETIAEKEIQERDKQKLMAEVALCKAKLIEHEKTEEALRAQLNVYFEKYDEFQNVLTKSNQIYSGFKGEMEKMSKKITRLEKETSSWKQKWESSQKALLQLASEKNVKDGELHLQSRQLSQLQKLCRTLQSERAALLQQLKSEGITPKLREGSPKEIENTNDILTTAKNAITPPALPPAESNGSAEISTLPKAENVEENRSTISKEEPEQVDPQNESEHFTVGHDAEKVEKDAKTVEKENQARKDTKTDPSIDPKTVILPEDGELQAKELISAIVEPKVENELSNANSVANDNAACNITKDEKGSPDAQSAETTIKDQTTIVSPKKESPKKPKEESPKKLESKGQKPDASQKSETKSLETTDPSTDAKKELLQETNTSDLKVESLQTATESKTGPDDKAKLEVNSTSPIISPDAIDRKIEEGMSQEPKAVPSTKESELQVVSSPKLDGTSTDAKVVDQIDSSKKESKPKEIEAGTKNNSKVESGPITAPDKPIDEPTPVQSGPSPVESSTNISHQSAEEKSSIPTVEKESKSSNGTTTTTDSLLVNNSNDIKLDSHKTKEELQTNVATVEIVPTLNLSTSVSPSTNGKKHETGKDLVVTSESSTLPGAQDGKCPLLEGVSVENTVENLATVVDAPAAVSTAQVPSESVGAGKAAPALPEKKGAPAGTAPPVAEPRKNKEGRRKKK